MTTMVVTVVARVVLAVMNVVETAAGSPGTFPAPATMVRSHTRPVVRH